MGESIARVLGGQGLLPNVYHARILPAAVQIVRYKHRVKNQLRGQRSALESSQ